DLSLRLASLSATVTPAELVVRALRRRVQDILDCAYRDVRVRAANDSATRAEPSTVRRGRA
ncbi:MAG TPA: hypothetical protein VKS25_04180, partial [Solirubrobacteraceae bacterium]|nr:hypothetical protein [Solirubrobacteraceae bacterium]